MPCIKELADVLVLVEALPETWQRQAVTELMRVLELAERDVAEEGLSPRERREYRWAELLTFWEKKDKAFADRLRRQRPLLEQFGEFPED
jgi:hypothetical protein